MIFTNVMQAFLDELRNRGSPDARGGPDSQDNVSVAAQGNKAGRMMRHSGKVQLLRSLGVEEAAQGRFHTSLAVPGQLIRP